MLLCGILGDITVNFTDNSKTKLERRGAVDYEPADKDEYFFSRKPFLEWTITGVIIHWNTVYLERAVNYLKSNGTIIDENLFSIFHLWAGNTSI
ncbi:hypothetical protein [Chryseobacterium gossypii]|uniref:hypothetical protein n=1 Tax=Chryseobacterium gossypii TaxID=3231602 RepID=UPI00352635AB